MPRPSPPLDGPSAYAERVLELVERVPKGKVVSYGDLAELVGEGGPRQVALVMSTWGGAVPWWRVLRSNGTHVAALRRDGMSRLRADGVPMCSGGNRVDMRLARWDGA